MIRYALFDLDDTLYPPAAGVLSQVGRRIERYLIERMGLSPEEARRLRTEYRDRYGTTLGGLMAHHNGDVALAEDYLVYVHDLPIEEMLHPDRELDDILAALPWECVVFTNSDWRHAERVLAALGVRRRFSRIFDITGAGYLQKPHPKVYEHVLSSLAVDGSACLMVDDGLRNLEAAKARHMTTVWVGPEASPTDGVDFAIPSIKTIVEVAAQLQARDHRTRQRQS